MSERRKMTSADWAVLVMTAVRRQEIDDRMAYDLHEWAQIFAAAEKAWREHGNKPKPMCAAIQGGLEAIADEVRGPA